MDVAEMKNRIQKALERDKEMDFWEYLSKLLKAIPPTDRKEVLDILGNATMQQPDITSLMQFSFGDTLKKFSYNEVLEMEKYVLEKYCLYPSETILTCFWAKIADWASHTKGRVYLTPYRIISTGPIELKTTKIDYRPSNVKAMKARVIERLEAILRTKFHVDLTHSPGRYGAVLATFDAHDIKINPKEVSWVVDLDYKDDKGKDQRKTLTYKVEIEKGPKEDNNSFTAKLPAIAATFKQILGN